MPKTQPGIVEVRRMAFLMINGSGDPNGGEFVKATEALYSLSYAVGSFDDEPESFARMEAFCIEHGYIRASKIHREIYLSDPRKTGPTKLKTVLRFPVISADARTCI
ncbi:GyrI-like domain-containing protein [Cohnella lubricantis]|uniref:GyrI-like domain-containing protein n=2 Tax=Cohnella lubricantis TaxID=2163172 RepID=A0A841TDZ7_9BACL|nr:GyrI-like domain-containing protein [Cohnella lubricantis]